LVCKGSCWVVNHYCYDIMAQLRVFCFYNGLLSWYIVIGVIIPFITVSWAITVLLQVIAQMSPSMGFPERGSKVLKCVSQTNNHKPMISPFWMWLSSYVYHKFTIYFAWSPLISPLISSKKFSQGIPGVVDSKDNTNNDLPQLYL
jgi:hypothetical protein